MNDIKIESDTEGFYDIVFEDYDLSILTDENDVLKNGMKMSILTRKNELSPNESYNDLGSRLYTLIKDNDSELTRSRIRSYIKECIEGMDRISRVDDIIFTPHTIEIYVTSKEGEQSRLNMERGGQL